MLEVSGQLYDGWNDFVALRNRLQTLSLGMERLASGDVVSMLPVEEMTSSPKRRAGAVTVPF